jgi:hypothetical protein
MAPGVAVATSQDDQGGLTIDIVLDAVAASVARGGNNVANAMERSYSLNRGRALY